MSGAVDLQKAIYDKLTQDPATLSLDFTYEEYQVQAIDQRQSEALQFLADNVVGIYDNPSQVERPDDNSQFPFITIGDTIYRPWDSDTETGTEATTTIHVWSRARHFIETKQVQQAIYNLLHRGTMVISGAVFIASDYISQDAQRDPDAITIHGVQEFRIIYDEVD